MNEDNPNRMMKRMVTYAPLCLWNEISMGGIADDDFLAHE